MRLHGVVLAAVIAMTAPLAVQEAAAVPVSGVAHEAGGPGVNPGAPAASPGQSFGDFSNAVGSPVLELTGDLALYGGVTHNGGGGNKWRDGWTMDFGSSAYNVVFNWQPTTSVFDGELVVGTTTYILGMTGLTIDLGTLSGVVSFLVDPIAGSSLSTKESAHWDVQATAVPIPAGGVLLLGGLVGLAFFRNRKKA